MTWEYAEMTQKACQAGGPAMYKLGLILKGYTVGLARGRTQGLIGGVALSAITYGCYKGSSYLSNKHKKESTISFEASAESPTPSAAPSLPDPMPQAQAALPSAGNKQSRLDKTREWLVLHFPIGAKITPNSPAKG